MSWAGNVQTASRLNESIDAVHVERTLRPFRVPGFLMSFLDAAKKVLADKTLLARWVWLVLFGFWRPKTPHSLHRRVRLLFMAGATRRKR